jgi:hypothetical protein
MRSCLALVAALGSAVAHGSAALAQDGATVFAPVPAQGAGDSDGRRRGRPLHHHHDGDGRYEVLELAAGRYAFNVSKGGYVTLQVTGLPPGRYAATAVETSSRAGSSCPRCRHASRSARRRSRLTKAAPQRWTFR